MNRGVKIGIVLGCLSLCLIGTFAHRALERQNVEARPGELYDAVLRQISAFRAADYTRAYQQVSSTFQERFNLEAFEELARSEYPSVLQADHVEFGSVRIQGRRAALQVYFFLPDGDVIPCIYSLIHEEGAWKIDHARVQKRRPVDRRASDLRA